MILNKNETMKDYQTINMKNENILQCAEGLIVKATKNYHNLVYEYINYRLTRKSFGNFLKENEALLYYFLSKLYHCVKLQLNNDCNHLVNYRYDRIGSTQCIFLYIYSY